MYTTKYYSAIKRNEIVPFREVDGPRDCYTEWSKSEREQILHNIAYMWDLEKWYRCACWQNRNRDTDVENEHMDTKAGKGEWDGLGDWDWHLYTIHTMYKIDN